MKTRFCTWRFLQLVKKAMCLFEINQTGDSVTFSKTGATVYYGRSNPKVLIAHEQYTDEEKLAWAMNGGRIFTLTYNQVAGCYWEAK